jgi:hypothetical protein
VEATRREDHDPHGDRAGSPTRREEQAGDDIERFDATSKHDHRTVPTDFASDGARRNRICCRA